VNNTSKRVHSVSWCPAFHRLLDNWTDILTAKHILTQVFAFSMLVTYRWLWSRPWPSTKFASVNSRYNRIVKEALYEFLDKINWAIQHPHTLLEMSLPCDSYLWWFILWRLHFSNKRVLLSVFTVKLYNFWCSYCVVTGCTQDRKEAQRQLICSFPVHYYAASYRCTLK